MVFENGAVLEHSIGDEAFMDSVSPKGRYGVVFEDDGDTGYFYALDTSLADQQILDALQIYDVESVLDRFKPSSFRVVWSNDGMKAGLIINAQYHAVFDFDALRGWCRSGFPPSKGIWSVEGHSWDDRVVELFE